jgi:hypothetical protein
MIGTSAVLGVLMSPCIMAQVSTHRNLCKEVG